MRLVLIPLLVAACGSDPAAGSTHTESGDVHINFTLDPAEPSAGETVQLDLEVFDHESYAPMASASVVVEPWMPMHNHGISEDVTVGNNGEGNYRATGFAFSMPGSWELRIDVDGDRATVDVEVQ